MRRGAAQGPTCADGILDVVIHAQGGAGVEVPAGFEGCDHGLALSHVGQHTQLQLPIVSHNQGMAFGDISCEGLADLQRAGGNLVGQSC